jgi:glycosyltransferase involved in cell wall biosynthesis
MEALLSVCIITYNHVNYIQRALEGVLMQKVNFQFKIIIADDFSTDGTRDILLDYEKKFPSLISLILQPKNVGPLKNWIDLIKTPKSKYIAYFEGDDYWTDCLKLQKQVNFLEKNIDFVICYHNALILSNINFSEDFYFCKKISEVSEYYDLLTFGNYMQSSTVVFRNFINTFPFEKLNYINDFILWFWLSRFGKIFRINDNMSVYRLGTGIWSTLSNNNKLLHTMNAIIEARKIVNNENDQIVIDNRINSITLSLLPPELQKLNKNHYNLNEYLSRNINIESLISSIFLKIIRNIFRLK